MTETEDPLVDIVIDEPGWEIAVPDLRRIATHAAELALDAAGLARDGFAVALLACGDERIAALNAGFRDRPEPTNVLSWPAYPLAAATPGAAPRPPPDGQAGGQAAGQADGQAVHRIPLGDVAIALQTVEREAETGGLPLKNHALHLILHGCLHLLGYDHERPEDAELMEGLERRALARAGIPDPYT